MMPRSCLLILAFASLAIVANPVAAAEPAGSSALEQGFIVSRDEQDRTTTVIVPTEEGRLDWNDVKRGLARAGRLDADALPEEIDGNGTDLTSKLSRFGIRTLSAAIPDVRMRVTDHPASDEPALSIRLDRGDARHKIRRMKSLIRDGFVTDGQPYGLRLDDDWDKQPEEKPLVVLVHGYCGGAHSLAGLHAELLERRLPCATFSYPNDGPLDEAAELLAEDLSEFQKHHPGRPLAFVAHSMGGLVVRAVIEDPACGPFNVARLIMICPPNHGSPWTQLPGGLECWEYMRSPERESLREAFSASIADGLNEARHDLHSGSPFLRRINARDRNPNVRYSIILGTGAPFTGEDVDQFHRRTVRYLGESRSGRFVMPRVDRFFTDLQGVASGQGDGVVSVESGTLAGVDDILLLPLDHSAATGKLNSPIQQRLLAAILNRLRP